MARLAWLYFLLGRDSMPRAVLRPYTCCGVFPRGVRDCESDAKLLLPVDTSADSRVTQLRLQGFTREETAAARSEARECLLDMALTAPAVCGAAVSAALHLCDRIMVAYPVCDESEEDKEDVVEPVAKRTRACTRNGV